MHDIVRKFNSRYTIKEIDIYKLALDYLKEKKQLKYFNNIIYDPTSKYLGSYNLETNTIILNDGKIIQSGYRLFDQLVHNYQIDEGSFTHILNYHYLYVLYHELTHVSQKAKYEENNNELFNYLYELGSIIRKNDLIFYHDKHDLFPTEIEAINKGWLRAYCMMNQTQLLGKERQIFRYKYIKSLLMNYYKDDNKHIIAPIDLLAKNNREVDINLINELLNKTNLSMIERMNLGLNINPEEYDFIKKEKIKILIKVNVNNK